MPPRVRQRWRLSPPKIKESRKVGKILPARIGCCPEPKLVDCTAVPVERSLQSLGVPSDAIANDADVFSSFSAPFMGLHRHVVAGFCG